MNVVKEFEMTAGGRVQIIKDENFYVYKIPHIFIPKETQLLEYNIQKALWERYNPGFAKPLFLREEKGVHCFAMEWFPGTRISFGGVRDLDKVAEILCECFKAMQDEGVYHNDLGFHNILWDKTTDDVKLIDFGNIASFQNDEKKRCFMMSTRRPKEFEGVNKLPPFKHLSRDEAMKLQTWNLGSLLLELLLAKWMFDPVRYYDTPEDFQEDLGKLDLENRGFIGKVILSALRTDPEDRIILLPNSNAAEEQSGGKPMIG